MTRALDSLQHQLWQLITAPSGAVAALAEHGDAGGHELAALVRGDRGLAPAARLEIYANAYFARIHDALRDDFSALARALGADAFHDLVKTYLMMHAPEHASLRLAGAHLSEHLRAPPFAEIFARRCPYAADLARLEWAISEAFFAADAPIVARAELAALAPEAWADVRFETAPSLRLLECAWPVQIARERCDAEGGEATWDEAPALPAEPTCLRVWRRDERVHYRSIPRLELEALGGARAGETFAALCDRVASAVGEVEAASRAAALLSSWSSDGLLARLR